MMPSTGYASSYGDGGHNAEIRNLKHETKEIDFPARENGSSFVKRVG
jgi:hypothetical protein